MPPRLAELFSSLLDFEFFEVDAETGRVREFDDSFGGVALARYHERVFTLFEQLDPSVDGTGIGLTLVRRIVELHGGKAWIESEGGGTAVFFSWPAAPGAESRKPS